MERNPVQARMLCIGTLQDDMLDHLYAVQATKIEQSLYDVAVKNQQILQCDSYSFCFNSKMYGSTVVTIPEGKINKELHPSLLKEVCNILSAPDFTNRTTKTHINHMFGIVLNEARHVDDLRQLLPDAFIEYIAKVDPDIFNTGNPLAIELITKIKKQVESSTAYINELCLTRLLLTK